MIRTGLAAALLGVTAAGALLSCSADAGPTVARITVSPRATLLTAIGGEATVRAQVVDGAGASVGEAVSWTTDDPTVASVDPSSGRITAVGGGTTTVRARIGDVEGFAKVEVYLPPDWALTVGESTFGRQEYIEYVVGNLPLIISAPHGGYEEPDEVARRVLGVLGQDRRTQEMARAISDAIFDRVGRRPHMIINRLHRNRLDANRDIGEAAQGDPFAEHAWHEYMELVDSAKARVVATNGTGLFIDLHGHGHEIQRVELGYLLSGEDLGRTDAALDAGTLASQSSIRRLASAVPGSFSALLRGPESMGGMLADVGVRSVPSPAEPSPQGAPYFTGGFNTRTHGSLLGGQVDGIQFELHWDGLRETEEGRAQFAQAFAAAVERYMATHFGLAWTPAVP